MKLKLAVLGAHDLDHLMPHISNRKLKVRKAVVGLKKNVSGKFLCDSHSIGASLF